MRRRLVSSNEATPAKAQHVRPCDDCPWRRDSIAGWLGPGSPGAWLQAAHGDGRINCHALTGVQCAGAAIYRTNVCKRPRNPELLLLAANKRDVFATPDEFRSHHVASRSKGPNGEGV